MQEFETGDVQANGLRFGYLEMGQGPLALRLHGENLAVMSRFCRLLDETEYLLPKTPAICFQAASILAPSNSKPARP